MILMTAERGYVPSTHRIPMLWASTRIIFNLSYRMARTVSSAEMNCHHSLFSEEFEPCGSCGFWVGLCEESPTEEDAGASGPARCLLQRTVPDQRLAPSPCDLQLPVRLVSASCVPSFLFIPGAMQSRVGSILDEDSTRSCAKQTVLLCVRRPLLTQPSPLLPKLPSDRPMTVITDAMANPL